ncbi:MAG: ATP-binding cassette domain-containing protein [Solirubrobacteraceae bacterium]
MSADDGIALRLDGVSKSFPGVKALADASLICKQGEVHALVGENGAGKSTLIKVACGALRADEGTVHIGGEELTRATPVAARRLGLLTAYQDTSLVPGLSVAENVLLSHHGVKPLGFRTQLKEMAALLEPYDLSFGPDTKVASLSPGSKQLLEVVRAMIHRPKVLLLDEPTAALDAANIAKLEGLIASALEHGTAILYITHRLDEVQRIADQLTVIRDGRIQGTYEREAWEVDDIVAMMVGVRTDLAFPPKPVRTGDEPVVLSAAGFRGAGFGPVDFTAARGEIVGIAGAEGNGQHEFVRTLVGLRSGRGDVAIEGTSTSLRTPAAARKRGIVFQSGDRAAESVFRELSVMDNATLAARKELGPIGTIIASRQRKLYEPVAADLGIVAASPYQPAAQLSGGNQQKAVVARSIIDPAKVLVVDEPTQGVDARARLDIYRAVRRQADDGVAVVVNSSDASELVGLCDRVYVMSRGRIVTELVGDQVQESAIVSAFVNVSGAKKQQAATEEQLTGRSRPALAVQSVLGSTWTPLAVIVILMLIIGGYTASFSDIFLEDTNLTSLLVIALPLMVVALGQQSALISGGFDISIGSSMTLGVILASFWVTQDTLVASIPGILLALLVGVGVGLLNAFIIRGLGVSPIIATIGTLGVLNGIGILLRPEPGGIVGTGISDALNKQVGFIPISFLGVVAVAVLCEMWLRATSAGLSVRATGLSEEAARRTGIQVERIKVGAYVFCAVLAVTAGLFLAVQVAVGQNGIASTYALPAFTACFLGGAALTGGRGSFVGAVLGAVFLTLLVNVTPLLELNSAWADTATGVLTILAVVAYSLTGDSRRVSVRWRSRESYAPQDQIALPRPGEPGTAESVANAAERS